MTSADADEVLEEERRVEADTLYARRSLIGKEGIARTELRPIGVIDIDGVRHDAVSETTLVQVGGKVRVTAVEPTSVRVRPLT
jgi:membrane-bound serine protease (ClpP class)